jgi:general secretion pathway protein D
VSAASGLTTNKRSIETKVLVDDGHTIILGGLIEDNKTETEQSVPLLGRLPLIGWLFRYTQKSGKRTNLMVFLRPVIIHGPQESYGVTADRYNYLRARTQDVGRQDVLDRFAPAKPTAEELKKYKKRSDDAEEPRAADAAPAASTPPAAAPTPPAPPAAAPAVTPD